MILSLQKAEIILFTFKINSSLFTKYVRKKIQTAHNAPLRPVSFRGPFGMSIYFI